MNKEILTALKGSIKKWEDIAAGTGKEEGAANCPLCLLFMDDDGCCNDCIVAETVSTPCCQNTPYDTWSRVQRKRWRKSDFRKIYNKADTPELVSIALKEVEFLKSLLPEEER